MQVIPRNHWTTQRARELRKGNNAAEGALWNVLKAHRLNGYKFARQHPVGPYFVDFAQRQQKLAIEVDGSQHVESEHDLVRDAFLLRNGWSVLRVWNVDILRRRDAVCQAITEVLNGGTPDSSIDLIYKCARSPSPTLRATSPASGRGK